MTTLKIKVTKEHLAESKDCAYGKHVVGQHCAIARAVRDIWPNAAVGRYNIYPSASQTKENIPMPEDAINFVSDFDDASPEQRLAMPELEFEITVPEWLIAKTDISEITRHLQNHPTLTLTHEY
jgi:hypothetical protein